MKKHRSKPGFPLVQPNAGAVFYADALPSQLGAETVIYALGHRYVVVQIDCVKNPIGIQKGNGSVLRPEVQERHVRN